MGKNLPSNSVWQNARLELIHRFGPEGGCSPRSGEAGSRPDSTAWACLALADGEDTLTSVQKARDYLATKQSEDGRVCLMEETPDAYWPTSLAILAWTGSENHSRAMQKAAHFLLQNTGRHFPRQSNSPVGHDTALRGWPWVAKTHSWVEPTSLAMIALNQCGFSQHERVTEASLMLMDRQLPKGGWNYGNTTMYGAVLEPFPQTTAVALSALAGRVKPSNVVHSLSYLQKQAPTLRTPLSLAWAILGLSAWNMRPGLAETWLTKCLGYQERIGSYETESLSLLCLAASGSVSCFGKSGL